MQFVTKLTLQGSTYIFSASIPRGFTSLFSVSQVAINEYIARTASSTLLFITITEWPQVCMFPTEIAET